MWGKKIFQRKSMKNGNKGKLFGLCLQRLVTEIFNHKLIKLIKLWHSRWWEEIILWFCRLSHCSSLCIYIIFNIRCRYICLFRSSWFGTMYCCWCCRRRRRRSFDVYYTLFSPKTQHIQDWKRKMYNNGTLCRLGIGDDCEMYRMSRNQDYNFLLFHFNFSFSLFTFFCFFFRILLLPVYYYYLYVLFSVLFFLLSRGCRSHSICDDFVFCIESRRRENGVFSSCLTAKYITPQITMSTDRAL